MKKLSDYLNKNTIKVMSKYRTFTLVVFAFIIINCSIFNTKGKYSDYDSENLKSFISANVYAPSYKIRTNAGGARTVSKEEKEKMGINGKVMFFFINKDSNSEVVLSASSYSTVQRTSNYINMQISEEEVISRKKHPNGETVIFKMERRGNSPVVIDCREGICLTISKEAGETDNDAALNFYNEISKKEIF